MFAPSRRTFSRPRIAAPAHTDALVREALDGHLWRLDDGRTARQAVSCLVAPQPGDRVLLAESSEGRLYVLHVLEREERGCVTLTVPGAQRLSIRQGSVHVAADRELALCAGEEAQLTAVRGPLTLTGRHLDGVLAGAERPGLHQAAVRGPVDLDVAPAQGAAGAVGDGP